MPRLRIDGYITLSSPLFIGAGEASSGADKNTILFNKTPFIPGSSIKGRVRHNCERIARALKIDICEGPQPDKTCPQEHLGKEEWEVYCPICRIFGSPWRKSHLIFSDWEMRTPEGLKKDLWGKRRKTDRRWGVAINRQRQTAQEDKLYTLQTSAHSPCHPDKWEVSIHGSLESEELAGLLFAGLLALRTVGGGSSRGLGWLDEDTALGLILKLDDQPQTADRNWLETQLKRLVPNGGTQS